MNISKKIVLVGHFGVGKTSLMRRFVDNEFSEDYKVTLGVQIKKKDVELSDQNSVSLLIWDIEGNTSITKTRRSYLFGAHSFIYVFDATRIETFENINSEIEYIEKHYPNSNIVTVCNKTDLVNLNSLKDILKIKGVKDACLTSAKTGENVEEMFHDLATKLIVET